MRRHKIIVLLACAFSGIVSSQAQIYYSYDPSGNRISRSTITLRSSQSLLETDSVSERIEKEGISKSLQTCKVTVFPNPTQGEVIVRILDGEEDATSEITIYSRSGQLLEKRKATGNVSVPIDLSLYESGLYLINFEQGSNKSLYKIIKQ